MTISTRGGAADSSGGALASAQTALPFRNELFAALVDSSSDAIVALALDGTFLSWNQGAERIYGYTATETIGRPITILMPPERAAAFTFGTARPRRTTEQFEVVHQHKDGRRIDVAVTVSPIRDAEERTVAFSAIIRDVTVPRRLAQERDQLAAIVAATHDSIIGWTLDGTITSWNPASERLYGYTAAEAIGRSILMLVPPEKMEFWHARAADLRQGRFFVGHETLRMHKDGRRIDVSMTVSPVYDADGQMVGFATLARDITEGRRAQDMIAVRARQLEAVAALGHEGLVAADLQALMERAVRLVADGLGIAFVNVLEFDAATNAMIHRAGVGWERSYIGKPVVPADARSLAGYTLPEAPRVVIVQDFGTETRFGRSAPLADHGIVSSMAVVIAGTGEKPYGVLGAHSAERRAFTQQDADFMLNVANVLAAAVQRTRAEEQQALMVSELEHRVKNTLAVVSAIVSLTSRNAQSLDQLVTSLTGRLEALARNQTLLSGRRWDACDLQELIDQALDPYRRPGAGNVTLSGPPVSVRPRAALALGMILHELATNAAKYGALSGDIGRLDLQWRLNRGNGEPRVQLRWIESGLAGVTAPSRAGFGTTLITRSIGMALSGAATFEYTPSGLHCALDFSLD